MNQGRYVFTQLVDFLPRKNFEWLVKKYEGNKYVKSFTCWNHLMVLLFGQLSNREGLRDLIVTITPFKSAFHHLGFGKNVSRSNLSKANEIREVSKRIRDAAFFLIIMLVTFAATLLKPQKYVSSRTIQKCVEHVSTST